jgi:hypothetical protein
MLKLTAMRTLLLIATLLLTAAGTYAQKHRENQEVTSLGLLYLSQSYQHLADYRMTSPEMQFRQRIRWQDFLVHAATRHIAGELTILRGGSLGLSYRPIIPYRDHWFEAGIFYTYDKQDPSITESGKQSGWYGTVAIYRPVSDWYRHEIRSSAGYYQGYLTDPQMASESHFVFPEMPRVEFSYLRFDLGYQAEFLLNPLIVVAEINYRKSKYTSETLLSLILKTDLKLSAGQRLEIYGGAQLTGLNESERLLTRDIFSETRFLLGEPGASLPPPALKPVQYTFGVRMAFLRGKKLRAF